MTDLDELSYPIGRFSPPAASLPASRAAHIETLRQLSERLCAVTAGLNDIQLDTPYREAAGPRGSGAPRGRQSRQRLYRFKLALTEDWPTIKPYDQAAWANLADSRGLPIGAPWQSSRAA